jgi:hypothetical protein
MIQTCPGLTLKFQKHDDGSTPYAVEHQTFSVMRLETAS